MKKLISISLCVILILSVFPVQVFGNSGNNLVQIEDNGGANPTDGNFNEDDVKISKIITPTDKENYFDITLNVTTSLNLSTLENQADMDIVVVLDKSYTMNDKMNNTEYSRLDNSKTAIKEIFKIVEEGKSGADINLALVAFDTNATTVFGLTNINSQTIPDMENLVDGIRTVSDENDYNRFTNIEAGLTLANNLLKNSSSDYKYIVLLTDGFPTTYINNSSDRNSLTEIKGYNPHMEVYTGDRTYGTDGYFYDPINPGKNGDDEVVVGRETTYGTSYSDKAADKAQQVASSIKSEGTRIYVVGIDIEGQNINRYIEHTENDDFSVVDCYESSANGEYVIGDLTHTDSYINWLRNKISGGIGREDGLYTTGDNLEQLKQGYNNLLKHYNEEILEYIKNKWIVSDEIPSEIGFEYFYDKDGNYAGNDLIGEDGEEKENTVEFDVDGNEIQWDLKNSGYTKNVISEGNAVKTYYTYTLKYHVRLKNENSDFNEDEIYNTNAGTSLKYVVSENGNLSDEKSIDFAMPKVIGYLGRLEFKKVNSSTKNGVSGAHFKLSHDEECSVCEGEVVINDKEAVSLDDGKVIIEEIPSGHDYILIETQSPEGYIEETNEYRVVVEYGVSVVYSGNNIITEIENTPIDSSPADDSGKDDSPDGLNDTDNVVKDPAPKTYDSSNIILYIVLLVSSAFVSVFVLFKKRNQK